MIVDPSPTRRTLASFENAYAVAVQLRETTGVDQFVVRTDNLMQPFQVSRRQPTQPETVLAIVAGRIPNHPTLGRAECLLGRVEDVRIVR